MLVELIAAYNRLWHAAGEQAGQVNAPEKLFLIGLLGQQALKLPGPGDPGAELVDGVALGLAGRAQDEQVLSGEQGDGDGLHQLLPLRHLAVHVGHHGQHTVTQGLCILIWHGFTPFNPLIIPEIFHTPYSKADRTDCVGAGILPFAGAPHTTGRPAHAGTPSPLSGHRKRRNAPKPLHRMSQPISAGFRSCGQFPATHRPAYGTAPQTAPRNPSSGFSSRCFPPAPWSAGGAGTGRPDRHFRPTLPHPPIRFSDQ